MDVKTIVASTVWITIVFFAGATPRYMTAPSTNRENTGIELSLVPEGKNAGVALTYDDGILSHRDIAMPMHLKYGFPGTFYAVVSAIRNQKWQSYKALDWNGIKELHDAGMEVGNHTMTHIGINNVTNPAVFHREAIDSQEEFRKHGIKTRTLAWGYNQKSPLADEYLRRSGQIARPQNITVTTSSWDEKRVDQYVSGLLKKGGNDIVLIHGVSKATGGWEALRDERLYEYLVSSLAKNADKIFLGTAASILEYESLVKATELERCDNGWKVKLDKNKTHLPPGTVYLRSASAAAIEVNGKLVRSSSGAFIPVRHGDTIRPVR